MAGIPPWPMDLKLSLNANNWLEWSWQLLTLLEMGQLDEYPLGLLQSWISALTPGDTAIGAGMIT